MKKNKTFMVLACFFNILLFFNCGESQNQESKTVIDTKKDSAFVSKYTIEKIVQLAIDLPELQQYFHIVQFPERKPLIIIDNEKFSKEMNLIKFNLPVKILPKQEINNQTNKSFIEFKKIEILKNTANTEFIFPVEGIKVNIEFLNGDGEWVVKKSSITEN